MAGCNDENDLAESIDQVYGVEKVCISRALVNPQVMENWPECQCEQINIGNGKAYFISTIPTL